jgi:hypothetical protein
MAIGCSDLTFTPDDEAVQTLRASWDWLLGENWSPILFSIWGDVFIQKPDGVVWVNTGTAEVTVVAADQDEFRERLMGESRTDWFLPELVDLLHAKGKRPALGQCFTYAIYPIFAEGKYVPENFKAVPAREHFGLSGDLHRQIRDLEDGSKVRLTVSD